MDTTTQDLCHCGAPFAGADHCPVCCCEQFEDYCDYVASPADLAALMAFAD